MDDSRHELTVEEQQLLNKYLRFYLELENGTRKPKTEAQEHFVALCKGRVGATTPHEIAFAKYRSRRAKEMSDKYQESHCSDQFPETEDGVPKSGWFTDNDYYNLHTSYDGT